MLLGTLKRSLRTPESMFRQSVILSIYMSSTGEEPRIDLYNLKTASNLSLRGRALQCASWGYPTEGAYYRDASSVDSLLAIKIPFFAVQAEDDPVSTKIMS
jgi:predicted alpha/beta-fold hydrolase